MGNDGVCTALCPQRTRIGSNPDGQNELRIPQLPLPPRQHLCPGPSTLLAGDQGGLPWIAIGP